MEAGKAARKGLRSACEKKVHRMSGVVWNLEQKSRFVVGDGTGDLHWSAACADRAAPRSHAMPER